MILTIDIGNSRIKWAAWQGELIVSRGAAVYAGKNLADVPGGIFGQLFAGLEKPSQIFAVCVAGVEISQALDKWVLQHWQLTVEYLKTEKKYKNISNAYKNPSQHGADRWAAVIAGHLLFPNSSVCVISAGTAITFDLINSNAQHLGGYILPSYVTMHTALMADTANIISQSTMQFNNNNNDVVPDNTNDAVNQGLHKLLQAGIRELCRSAEQAMAGPVKIIITGGFAQAILNYPDMPDMLHHPDLVMQGLYDIMQQRA